MNSFSEYFTSVMQREIIQAPFCSQRVENVSFGLYVFWGGGGGISNFLGAFPVVLSTKGK